MKVSRNADIAAIRRRLPRALRARLPRQIAVVRVSESASRSLNRRYRKKNAPTNVLSFRYGTDEGEIVVCPAVIQREAKRSGNTYFCQMRWMIVHGMLHLSGVHHERSLSEKKKSEAVERRAVKKIAFCRDMRF